ncbi:hypothetical protein LX15_005750 [Streptoalloteichus tenebrarius]|uniref:N-acetyltransferase n=1 Tax=Streptoalloteichus tenebrarius (strain ATCC 17920 / DSM 40477 / JCM 4838 / CBS 697.72 / NBRC 16177 / NCIMB 11028 / NRRL B-12390 / A12253. 1 / ISP 5477) TaxID=1933 RepID=A0ABT1I2J9_STRSD|nr:N-acetyltransferase [Streptoalloteichus tenebrarius]MCP2262019.1 hypothetical protein [Streptoalloteichus tenebrarius]BFF02141.1 hypothetical protein GCM10020241_38160 [Streptoalloteichus tenebrarius]
MDLVTLADRPDLEQGMWELETSWPPFMVEGPMSTLFDVLVARFPEYQVLLVEGDAEGGDRVVGRGHAVPFAWDGDPDSLPPGGWDAILAAALGDAEEGLAPTAASALEIVLDPRYQGKGLSSLVATALRDNVARLGLSDLVVPLRPNHKHLEPRVPLAEYVRRVRPDGLPHDPWLRVHVRLGAEIVRVCPASMAIAGSLAQWREWTGLPFDRSGEVEVPEALTPVHVSVEHDHAVYVEPNVWLRHRLA